MKRKPDKPFCDYCGSTENIKPKIFLEDNGEYHDHVYLCNVCTEDEE